MQESMKVAKTVAWNLLSKKKQDNIRTSTSYGIHIHCPEGATPKGGPSAEKSHYNCYIITDVTITGVNTCAMTEIDLNGYVYAWVVYILR